MIVLGLFVLALLCYLIGTVAYNAGIRSNWEEISKNYIVLHKSVIIQPNKPLDKRNKKMYHKRVVKPK